MAGFHIYFYILTDSKAQKYIETKETKRPAKYMLRVSLRPPGKQMCQSTTGDGAADNTNKNSQQMTSIPLKLP